MRKFQKTATVLSSVALLLALGACGKHDESASTAANDTSTSTASSQSLPSSSDTSSSTTASTLPSTTDNSSSMASSSTSSSDSSTMASNNASTDTSSNTSVMGAAGDKMDDAGIVTKVKTSLAADSDLSALKIDVDAKDGVVTLTGTAPSKAAKDKATDIAKNTKDVKDVKNNLKVSKG